MTPEGGWTLLGLWIALIVLTALVLLVWRLRLGVRMTFGRAALSGPDHWTLPHPADTGKEDKKNAARNEKNGKA